MFSRIAGLALAASLAVIPGVAHVQTPELDQQLTAASRQLAALPFDAGSSVTVHGRLTTLVFPRGETGMILVEAEGGAKYAFSTARVPDLSKQGFTRFTMHPGQEVTVSGVFATGKPAIGPGFTGARADSITTSNGTRVFDRSALPASK